VKRTFILLFTCVVAYLIYNTTLRSAYPEIGYEIDSVLLTVKQQLKELNLKF